jgi:hypothetical protein
MGYTLNAMQIAARCTSQEPEFEQVVEAKYVLHRRAHSRR